MSFFESLQQLRPLDLYDRSWPTSAHLAKRAADLGGSHSIHRQSFCASARPNQRPSNEGALPNVGCYTVQTGCFQWQQHCHHYEEALYEPSQQNLCVCYSHVQIGDVALSILIVSDGNSITITTEKYCVTGACRNLVVCKSGIQRRDVALPLSVAGSNGNSTAIAEEKNCMTNARRNLGVFDTLIQTWDGRQPYGASPQ